MAAIQEQSRRGTTAQCAAMTPAAGEVIVNTTTIREHIGDGAKAGGHILPNAADIQNQAFIYSTSGGTANALTLTNSERPVTAYAAGLRLKFKASLTNTAATTVAVDGLAAQNIYKISGTSLVALAGSEIVTGGIYEIVHDGTQFQLRSGTTGGVVSVKRQIITSSGTYTPSSGMLYCDAEVQGAGGGGGSAAAASANFHAAAGGNSGAYSRSLLTAAQIGASQAVTVGVAAAAATTGATGGTGGTSSLGALLSSAGGSGGEGTSNPAALPYSAFPSATIALSTLSDTQIHGFQGSPSLMYTATRSISGNGANSLMGHGGIGLIARGTPDAAGRGGGGGGAQNGASNVTSNGGVGGIGLIVITEYCSQ